MSTRLTDLAEKKQMLRERSALLRDALADQVEQGVAPAFGVADRVIGGVQWLRRHPVWLIAPAVALLVWRPRVLGGALQGGLVANVTRWAGRGVWLWQAWQRLQPMLAALKHRAGSARGDGL